VSEELKACQVCYGKGTIITRDWQDCEEEKPCPECKEEAGMNEKKLSEDNSAGTWPEQNAVDAWFEKHSMELKSAVTEYRTEIQKELDIERERTKELISKLDEEMLGGVPCGYRFDVQVNPLVVCPAHNRLLATLDATKAQLDAERANESEKSWRRVAERLSRELKAEREKVEEREYEIGEHKKRQENDALVNGEFTRIIVALKVQLKAEREKVRELKDTIHERYNIRCGCCFNTDTGKQVITCDYHALLYKDIKALQAHLKSLLEGVGPFIVEADRIEELRAEDCCEWFIDDQVSIDNITLGDLRNLAATVKKIEGEE